MARKTVKQVIDNTIISAGNLLKNSTEKNNDRLIAEQQARSQPQPVPTQATPTPTPQDQPKVNAPTVPEVIRDGNTGKISGIKFPDGRVFQGLSSGEVNAMVNHFNGERQLPQGTQEAGTARVATENIQQQQQAIQTLSTPNNQAAPSVQLGANAQDLAATVGTSIPSIVGGATAGAGVGAGIGTLAAPVVGTAIGGAIGGVIGGLSALAAKIAVDKHQATKEAKRVYIDAKGYDTNILNMANSGAYNPSDLVHQYEVNLANVRESERELRAQTRTAVGEKLSGAMDELLDVQLYLSHEHDRRLALLMALQNPNPSIIYPPAQDLNSGDNTP